MKKLSFVVLLSIALSACTSIPLKTMYKLARTNPLELDPMALRAAVRMPESIRPRPDSAKLSLSISLRSETPEPEVFILQPVNSASETTPLAKEEREGDKIWVYRLNPKDRDRLEKFRAYAKAFKTKNKGNTKGQMTIGVDDTCRQGELPASGKLLVTNWIKLDAESDYLATAVDYDLQGSAIKGKTLDKMLLPCE